LQTLLRMKVSVILPNYNHAPYLNQRIDSILNQTYKDFEITILDDCSADNSKNVIEQYRPNPKVVEIHYNETNSGSTFKQWNKGISKATGDLIWIAESDDWCKNNFLEIMVNAFIENKNCVVAYAQSYCIDEQGKIRWQSEHNKIAEYVNGDVFFKERLAFGCTIFNASMAVFKREYALQIPAAFTSFKLCGDWLFWICMSSFGDVFISGQLLNYFRKHDGNVSNSVYASGYNFIEELKVIELVRNDNRATPSLMNKVIYNKYNNYLYKKSRFNENDIKNIEQAFYNLYGSKYAFMMMVFSMRAKAKMRKVFIRLKMLFQK